MKNKGITLLLSIIFPGLGHLYIRHYKKGLFILIISMVILVLTNSYGVVAFLHFPVIIYSIIDSLALVNQINEDFYDRTEKNNQL